jgi:transcriptional regulator GlxA family with amidase domain
VGFVLLDAFTLAAFGGMVDVLRLAADRGGRSRQINAAWRVMSVNGEPRRSSCGVTLSPLLALGNPADFDYIAVCGGNDYMNPRVEPALLEFLHAAASRRVRLLGVCTGTFTIARAGLADGRDVCVHWNVLDEFQQQFPASRPRVDQIFVDEGDLITCAGSTAAIDMGLYLVNRHCGADKARQAMRHMMLQEMRAPKVPQPHFHSELPVVHDVRVRQAIKFIMERLDDPPRLEVIARFVGVSVRQLERAFDSALSMSPYTFQRQLRLRYAKWLLSETDMPVTRIAIDCGFSDGAHFSRDFASVYKSSPTTFRRGARSSRLVDAATVATTTLAD